MTAADTVRIALAALALTALPGWAQPLRPETPMLGREAYRTPLEEIIVTGRAPYWKQQAPRWEQPKVEIPLRPKPPRLQVLPRYTGEERDEYQGVRDTQNPKPRMKLFELKF